MEAPTFADVLEARTRIAPYLRADRRSASTRRSAELLDATVFVKHENHHPTGAFKVRGGVNLVSQLSADERERGVVAASTGNHGQSIAFGARLFGVKATICVPEDANPVKVAAMRDLGAEVVPHGVDFDEAREHCEQLADRARLPLHPLGQRAAADRRRRDGDARDPRDEPRIDMIIVPIGGGSGAAGACIVAKTLDPSIRVIGVQSDAAPAAYRSWQRPAHCVEDEMGTFAEGLATRVAFELPQRIMWELLDDFVLVERRRDPRGAAHDDRVDAQPDRGGGRRAARRGAATPRRSWPAGASR